MSNLNNEENLIPNFEYIPERKYIDDICDGVNKVADKAEEKDPNVNVIIAKDKREMKPLNPFVIVFYENFQSIILEHKLNATEILIVLEILKAMSYGNLISISQTEIATFLGLPKQNVNRAFSKFRKSGLLVKSELGTEYVNSQIIAKGSLWKHRDAEIYYKSVETTEQSGLKKSF